MGVLEQTLRWVTAIGVPLLITILVPFGFAMSHDIGEIKGELLRVNANLTQLEQRADRTDAANGERFGALDAGLRASLARMDQQFERVDNRFDEERAWTEAELDERFAAAEARADERLTAVERRMEDRFAAAEARADDRFAAAEAIERDRFAAAEAMERDRFAAAEASSVDRFAETERRLERLETAGATRDARLDEFGIQLARTNERLGAIDAVVRENRALLERRGEQIDEIARGLERTETDPAIVLSRIGVPIDADVAAFWIGGRVVSVPRTDEAQQALVEAGFERVAVSPAIIGYVAPTTGATPQAIDP